jgi:hypothetical protein
VPSFVSHDSSPYLMLVYLVRQVAGVPVRGHFFFSSDGLADPCYHLDSRLHRVFHRPSPIFARSTFYFSNGEVLTVPRCFSFGQSVICLCYNSSFASWRSHFVYPDPNAAFLLSCRNSSTRRGNLREPCSRLLVFLRANKCFAESGCAAEKLDSPQPWYK